MLLLVGDAWQALLLALGTEVGQLLQLLGRCLRQADALVVKPDMWPCQSRKVGGRKGLGSRKKSPITTLSAIKVYFY